MKVVESLDRSNQSDVRGQETIIHFEEGLIGFSDFKNFNLLENNYLAPFRLLRAVNSSEVGFLVIDPSTRIPDYCQLIPAREWESIGVSDPADRLAFVTVVLGPTAEESTGNFQAPLLINHNEMIGKQVILTDSGFSVRQPLL